ncbi:MAG TPA: dihydrolipoamide acetyltransferase family protein [Gemmatimonadales bacterium]|nr:dihydrolipoamide acetyltransferase family protein [Gemmatimonadales bacterium]
MEALSPTMEEGRLVEWKKNEGDTVAAGDVLAEVETDKAVMELVARAGGTLLKQVIPIGTTLPVGGIVAWLGAKGEAVPDGAGGQGPAASAPKPATAASAPAPAAAATAPAPGPLPPASSSDRIKASPLAKKMAKERGLDLGRVQGSGPSGRVVLRDLEGASAQAASVPMAVGRASTPAPGVVFEDVPLSQIRKTIAKRLSQSLGPIPTFYLTMDVDMTRSAEAREALKALGPDGKVSFNDILIKAVATALVQHPACNAWWMDDRIRVWRSAHIGMAVAIEDGLITPVIRNAEQKSLREISAESRDLAGRARERKLKPEEYTGSTFSISNLGMFDIEHFTAIINPPEAGILAVGKVREEPAVVNGQLAVRQKMRMTMSCDHRAIDGATGAAFLKTLKTLLENPLALVW